MKQEQRSQSSFSSLIVLSSLFSSTKFSSFVVLLFGLATNAAPDTPTSSTKASSKTSSPKSTQQKNPKGGKTAQNEHEKRFFRALKNIESKNEEARIRMSIQEEDGSTKDRELAVRRLTVGKEQRVLARILAPADLKGMSLFSIVEKKSENQWIYFPSSKQTRKIVTADSSEVGILGSELQYNDFDPAVIRKSTAKLLKTDACGNLTCDWVEATPKGDSPYSKVIVMISNSEDLPLEMEYFKGTEKIKTVVFSDYKKISGIQRPHKLVIKNLKNNRGTEIQIDELKVNFDLSPDQISLQQISRPF